MSPSDDSRTIPVVRTTTRGAKPTPMVAGVTTAGVLADRYVIPRRDHRAKTGYQREVSVSRVNRLMNDLRAGRVDLPTSILVNLRDFVPARDLSESDGHSYLELGKLNFHVVDGQHRVEALSRLVAEDPDRWATFEIPFVAMLGATEREEMRQFYVVNSTAKSVRTDLALDLLKQQAESDPNVWAALTETGETWKVKGQQLVEDLEKDSSLWRRRVRFPGEPTGGTVIGSAGLVASVKTLLNTPYFGQISTPQQVKILDAYWEGIRRVIPEVFPEPTEYVIQKSTGVQIMHGLLISVLEYIRSAGRSVLDPEAYEGALSAALLELEGDTSSGDIARGVDFWRAGPDGAAGSYSSNAGRRVLTARLRSALPPIDVE